VNFVTSHLGSITSKLKMIHKKKLGHLSQICDSTKNFIVLELFFDYQKNALFSKIAISQQIQYNTQLFKIVALELALNSLKIKTKNQKSGRGMNLS
jgi:hypothetical protein